MLRTIEEQQKIIDLLANCLNYISQEHYVDTSDVYNVELVCRDIREEIDKLKLEAED